MLPVDNPLFSAWKANANAEQLAAWVVMDGTTPSLPIIPLLGECQHDQLTEAYPTGVFSPHKADFQDALGERLDALMDHAVSALAANNIFTKIFLSIGEFFEKEKLQEDVTSYIEKSLKDWKL